MSQPKHLPPLHRKAEQEETVYVVSEEWKPVAEYLVNVAQALNNAVTEALRPVIPILAQMVQAVEENKRRMQPRKKPALSMLHRSSVRRRILAYRRQQIGRH